jgi:hypothetical protein
MTHFPTTFALLERYSDWALPTEIERLRYCACQPMDLIQAFYAAFQAEQAEVMDYLAQRPISDLSAQDTRLMHLAMAFVEAAIAVEMYGEPDCRFASALDTFIVCNELPIRAGKAWV